MNSSFKEITPQPDSFFSILPQDWQDSIIPCWKDYKESSRVFVLENMNNVAGGGIIFTTVPPDMLVYKEEADYWFGMGYLYIGFLFVKEEFRHQDLGTEWLKQAKEFFHGKKFWLSIEEHGLSYFYERNGFKVIKTIGSGGSQEWVMAAES